MFLLILSDANYGQHLVSRSRRNSQMSSGYNRRYVVTAPAGIYDREERRQCTFNDGKKKKKLKRIGDMSKLARLEFDPPRVITIN